MKGELLRAGIAIPAILKRGAREVDVDGRSPSVKVYLNEQVGVLRVDIGTFAALIAQAVADGILHAQRRIARVTQLVVGATGVHGNRRAGGNDILPGNVTHARIEAIGVGCLDAFEHQQDTARDTRPQQRGIGPFKICRERRRPPVRGRTSSIPRPRNSWPRIASRPVPQVANSSMEDRRLVLREEAVDGRRVAMRATGGTRGIIIEKARAAEKVVETLAALVESLG